MTERRNPYFVLGLDYGTTERDLINRGLSRATKRVRSHTAPPFDMADCTWATEELLRHPPDAADVTTFRVPADPAVFQRSHDVAVPPPENLGRTTGPSDAALTRLRADILADIGGAGLEHAVATWLRSVGIDDDPA